ncbi:MAG: ATP-binding protein, partial [Bacteroidota bacterium]
VKGKDVYGVETEATEIAFYIARPWYLSTLALIIYAATLLFLLMLVARMAQYRQRKKNIELTRIVNQRTLELRVAVAEAEQAKNRAEEANNAKSAFFANMTHEIRTPINGVIGITDILRYTNPTEEQNEYLRAIRRSGENLLRIVNEILDFSKIEAGKMELEEAEFDLYDLMDEILMLFASQRSDKEVDLACLIDPKIPKLLKGDPHKLRQVLINLIGNAMKFTERGGVMVRIRFNPDAEKVEEDAVLALRVEVEDTGIGISEEQGKKLFQAFGQAEAGTSRKFGGTGLGLTISAKLVEFRGSRLWYKVGCTRPFKFRGKSFLRLSLLCGSKVWYRVRTRLRMARRLL